MSLLPDLARALEAALAHRPNPSSDGPGPPEVAPMSVTTQYSEPMGNVHHLRPPRAEEPPPPPPEQVRQALSRLLSGCNDAEACGAALDGVVAYLQSRGCARGAAEALFDSACRRAYK